MASVKASEESVEMINKIAKTHKLDPVEAADKVIRYGFSRVKALTKWAETHSNGESKPTKKGKKKVAAAPAEKPTKKGKKKSGKKGAKKAKKPAAEQAASSEETITV